MLHADLRLLLLRTLGTAETRLSEWAAAPPMFPDPKDNQDMAGIRQGWQERLDGIRQTIHGSPYADAMQLAEWTAEVAELSGRMSVFPLASSWIRDLLPKAVAYDKEHPQ